MPGFLPSEAVQGGLVALRCSLNERLDLSGAGGPCVSLCDGTTDQVIVVRVVASVAVITADTTVLDSTHPVGHGSSLPPDCTDLSQSPGEPRWRSASSAVPRRCSRNFSHLLTSLGVV